MSNNSNEANPNISIEELFKPRISVERLSGKIYLFFGKTPRAQLNFQTCSRCSDSNHTLEAHLAFLTTKFPQGKVSFQ